MTPEERLVISVSGKGGTGKTTVAALVLKLLLEKTKGSILVVDADPSTNLPDVLHIPIRKTVGMVATELKKQISEGRIPPGVTKGDLLEARVHEVLVENPRFDLLTMGRTEGEGCYCLVNTLLTKIIDTLSKNYDITLMDMEAGLEHLSRRTDRDVDIMLITTDPSKMGLQTALRIKNLANEVHINFKHMYLIGNQIPEGMKNSLQKEADKMGLKLVGIVPTDSNVMEYSITGKSLLDLPKDSPALEAMRNIVKEIGILSS